MMLNFQICIKPLPFFITFFSEKKKKNNAGIDLVSGEKYGTEGESVLYYNLIIFYCLPNKQWGQSKVLTT